MVSNSPCFGWFSQLFFFQWGRGEKGPKLGYPQNPSEKMAYKCITFSSTQENQVCIACDLQKPMIMKQVWYFPCTLLVFKLCGPPQHNMLSCRKISLTSQNLMLRYGWIQGFISQWFFLFLFCNVSLLSQANRKHNDKRNVDNPSINLIE